MASCTSTKPSGPLQSVYFLLICLFHTCNKVLVLSYCSKMTSLTEDVRRSAMVCILTVPATMTSHDLMKLMAPFNDVMEHMKIIRDSTPNQYMVLIKFCTQVRSPQLLSIGAYVSSKAAVLVLVVVQADADSFYTACNGRQFNSIEEAVCQLIYVERAEVLKSEEVNILTVRLVSSSGPRVGALIYSLREKTVFILVVASSEEL